MITGAQGSYGAGNPPPGPPPCSTRGPVIMAEWVIVNVTKHERLAVFDEESAGYIGSRSEEACLRLIVWGSWSIDDDLRLLRIGENQEGGYRVTVNLERQTAHSSGAGAFGAELGLVVDEQFSIVLWRDLPVVWLNATEDVPQGVPLLCLINGEPIAMIAHSDGEGYLHWERVSDISGPTHYMRYPALLPSPDEPTASIDFTPNAALGRGRRMVTATFDRASETIELEVTAYDYDRQKRVVCAYDHYLEEIVMVDNEETEA